MHFLPASNFPILPWILSLCSFLSLQLRYLSEIWAEAGHDAITVKGVNFATIGDVNSVAGPAPDGDGLANGVALTISERFIPILLKLLGQELRVCVRSDFIRDKSDRAPDGDHLPLWVPKTLEPDRQSGDGIEGGAFESFFTLED